MGFQSNSNNSNKVKSCQKWTRVTTKRQFIFQESPVAIPSMPVQDELEDKCLEPSDNQAHKEESNKLNEANEYGHGEERNDISPSPELSPSNLHLMPATQNVDSVLQSVETPIKECDVSNEFLLRSPICASTPRFSLAPTFQDKPSQKTTDSPGSPDSSTWNRGLKVLNTEQTPKKRSVYIPKKLLPVSDFISKQRKNSSKKIQSKSSSSENDRVSSQSKRITKPSTTKRSVIQRNQKIISSRQLQHETKALDIRQKSVIRPSSKLTSSQSSLSSTDDDVDQVASQSNTISKQQKSGSSKQITIPPEQSENIKFQSISLSHDQPTTSTSHKPSKLGTKSKLVEFPQISYFPNCSRELYQLMKQNFKMSGIKSWFEADEKTGKSVIKQHIPKRKKWKQLEKSETKIIDSKFSKASTYHQKNDNPSKLPRSPLTNPKTGKSSSPLFSSKSNEENHKNKHHEVTRTPTKFKSISKNQQPKLHKQNSMDETQEMREKLNSTHNRVRNVQTPEIFVTNPQNHTVYLSSPSYTSRRRQRKVLMIMEHVAEDTEDENISPLESTTRQQKSFLGNDQKHIPSDFDSSPSYMSKRKKKYREVLADVSEEETNDKKGRKNLRYNVKYVEKRHRPSKYTEHESDDSSSELDISISKRQNKFIGSLKNHVKRTSFSKRRRSLCRRINYC